jgi:hypothetical protein
VPNAPKKIGDGPINMAPSKKEKNSEPTHEVINMNHTMSPKILPLPLAWVKNGDEQFWKEKFHAADRKAQHALMNNPGFFFLRVGGGRGEIGIFCFFPCSQWVPLFKFLLKMCITF